MNIQKIEDSGDPQQPMMYAGHGQVMSVPDVGAPRSNPLTMIWRRKGIVAVVVIVCVLVAMVKYMVSTQVFRSEAKLLIQTRGAKSGGGGDSSGGGGAGQGNLNNEVAFFRSEKLLAILISREDVTNSKTMALTPSHYTYMKNNVAAGIDKNSDVITLTFESPYPKEAQTILQALVDSYSEFYTKERTAKVGSLERSKSEYQRLLGEQEKKLAEAKKTIGALAFNTAKGSIAQQTADRLGEALIQAKQDTVDARTELDSARKDLNDPARMRNMMDYLRSKGVSIPADPNEQTLRNQLLAMEAQLEDLNRKYMEGHPAIRAAQATVASLRARIGEIERNQAQGMLLALEQKLASSKNRETELRASYEEQFNVAAAFSEKQKAYTDIEKAVKSLTDKIDDLDRDITKETVADTGAPVVNVLDKPSDAVVVRPNRELMLFYGLMVGLIVGCGAALVRDVTDQGLRSGEEITDALGVALLGSVPHMAGPANPMAQGRKVDLEPASDVAETYRTIRTAVFFGTPERESRTILVTSPAPGDGKSTFASNLAIAMAQTGKRVLLVDCDFRRPVQHRIFECRPGIGLSSVLAGHESLDKAIQNTGIAGLDILPAGPVPSNPSEILNSQSFNEVLEELSVRYEHVVVDSPPVMAVADSRILAAMCSVTILVLRAESTTRKSALHARRALQSVGAAILGVVVNDVPRARDRYGDYGGYSGYRAKYNGGQANGGEQQANGSSSGGGKSTAMIPARSFLDLRRK